MQTIIKDRSVDYLAVGHVTRDILPNGTRIGGTVAYSAMTASSMGLNSVIVTASAEDLSSDEFDKIDVLNINSDQSTQFRNIDSGNSRAQYIYEIASKINFHNIPDAWRSSSIVHLGPVANELNPNILQKFDSSFVCVTPQGWFRSWDKDGLVSLSGWNNILRYLDKVAAVVVSIEDIDYDETFLEALTQCCKVVAVTHGSKGVNLFWNGDVRRFKPPVVEVVDTTGAGDIFAASFFVRLFTTRDPWESARFASRLAAYSTTRYGLKSVPTQKEISQSFIEIL